MKNIHGGDIYRYENILDFSANVNPLGTPPSIIEAVEKSLNSIVHYPDIYCEKLREKIAAAEMVEKETVICGNGAADLIYRLVFAKRPKKALILAPGFAEYEQALCACGTEIVYYYLNHKDFRLDETFLEALTEDLDMICICSPNNPTGAVIEPELLHKISIVCKKKHIFMLMDECFNNFLEEPEIYTLLELAKKEEHIFILKAFTKMYGMAGIRLGYGICTDSAVLEKMYEIGPPWNVSVLAQAAGIAALDEKEFTISTRKYIKKEKEKLYGELDKLGIQYWKTDANYIFFKDGKGLKELLLEKGILIRDCSNYPGLEEGYYRIAVKSDTDNRKLVETLWEVKKEMCDMHTMAAHM